MTLMVASRIESLGFRRPEDNKFPEHSTERFEQLNDLWAALDARKVEMAEEKSKREAKVSTLNYFCAAEDCGIVVTKKFTLGRCSGMCPPAFKPHYCSRDCQRTVRFPSDAPDNCADLSCRIGNNIDRSANRTLQNPVLVRIVVRVRPLLGGGQTPLKIPAPAGSNRARNGPST